MTSQLAAIVDKNNYYWIGSLTEIDPEKGYIFVNRNDNFYCKISTSGEALSNIYLIDRGWHFISFDGENDTNLLTAVSGTGGEYIEGIIFFY